MIDWDQYNHPLIHNGIGIFKRILYPNRKALGLFAASAFVFASSLNHVISYVLIGTFSEQLKSQSKVPSDQIGQTGNESVNQTYVLSNEVIDKILKRNLFNKTGELADEDRPVDGETEASEVLVKTSLPLKLIGVIYGGSPFTGSATIENAKRKVNSFAVGDTVENDAVIAEIYLSRVILRRSNGQREYLELDRKELVRTQRQRKKSGTSSAKKSSGPPKIATKPADRLYKEEGFERDGEKMIMSEDYKNRLLSDDLTKTLQDAKASPHVVDNRIEGFVLTRIREGSIYRKAGLENGDIVKEINGVRLRNPQSAIRHLQTLRRAKEIEILVERNGGLQTFNLSVR